MLGIETNPIEAAAADSQHYQVLKELGDCYLAMDDLGRARLCYEQATELSPDEAAPYVAMGVLAIHEEDHDAAADAFEAAVELDEDCSEAYNGLAMIYHQQQDFASAFEMYLKCLELDTDNLVALLGLFQTSCQMGSFEQIIRYLETYLQRHPGDTSVLFCLATLEAREGRLVEAQAALLDVLSLEPEKVEAARLLNEVDAALAAADAQQALSA